MKIIYDIYKNLIEEKKMNLYLDHKDSYDREITR